MGITSKWMRVALVTLAITAFMAGCTRDRSTPTPEATAASAVQPVVEPAITRDAAPTTASTPAATPEPTETPIPKTVPYTVQPNDVISTVAEKFGLTTQELKELNLLPNNDLQVGQVLRVPFIEGATAEGLPTPTPGPFTYTVQTGDTLFSIALKFDVASNEIVAANTLADPNSVYVGQELLIPGYQPSAPSGATAGGDSSASPGAPAIHIVQAGEVLSVIAEKYGVSVAELVAANRIADPNLVSPGTELIIPGLTAAELEAANQIVHIVAAGESLGSIATQYGVSIAAIIEANRIANPDLLRVGDRLIIPQ